ncbi:hypothetical protein AAE02nite_42470 [Adhaeribacter aerolatus]|uniref:Outer membrane protein beta-barrel domain-containing protein n=1 Tax=Adhaeribacter aerolatus TaxID=670289 RepID=A0A512B3P2_9BACT|nr:hypothetical protein [Adhaeribacter aerolatus]GEO06583.1 hypothetical protein AAE02nite_42470 [Adhaeribacter aerolatus]
MKTIRFFLLVCLLGISAKQTKAWAQAPTKLQLGSSVSTSLSYTGLSVSAGLGVKWNNLALLLGPRFLLTDSYRLASGPWGGAAAFYYYTSFSASRRLQGFANLDYQNSFQRPYCPTGDCRGKRNTTQEVSLGYGLQYGLSTRLSVFNAINVGLYHESVASRFRDDNLQVQGLNMLVKLGLAYYFKNED